MKTKAIHKSAGVLFSIFLACVWFFQPIVVKTESIPTPTGQKNLYAVPGANLIIISIDTLRSDRLGCYGYDAPTSPAIDRFASRGVRFARVIAESSWTLPSHMTLMTSLYPSSHGVVQKNKMLNPKVPTLGQVLHQKGYRLYANTCGAYVNGAYGFDRGFETYDNTRKPFADTLRSARAWIEGLKPDEHYFVFLHTFDVHCPYDPPSKYRLMFLTRPVKDQLETRGKCGETHYNKMTLTKGQVRFLSDMYDAGIRAADENLGVFLKFLEERGAFKDTVVILLSDHGEEFHEHGKIGHERTLYIESLLVPLIIVAPGLAPGVVQAGVGLADVMPTALAMLGINSPPGEGHSLLPLMISPELSCHQQPLFSETDRKITLRSLAYGQYHFILDPNKGKRELYDLKTDPTEQTNLKASMPKRAQDFEKILGLHFRNLPQQKKSQDRQLTKEQMEKLRSLGYVD